ncbi:MAG: hypothetical protein MJ174_10545 [Treponema sp.]|nr:hypothetical protein [Treponema sp.]
MQKQNPEWFYKYSENLKQNIALNKKTGWVYCEDGTKYSPEENAILKSTGQPILLQIHIVKKMFDGVLVSAGNICSSQK